MDVLQVIKELFFSDEQKPFSASEFYSFFGYYKKPNFIRFLDRKENYDKILFPEVGKDIFFNRDFFLSLVKNKRPEFYPNVESIFLDYKRQLWSKKFIFLKTKTKTHRNNLRMVDEISGEFYNYSLSTYNIAKEIGLCPYDLFKFAATEFIHKTRGCHMDFINRYSFSSGSPIPDVSYDSKTHTKRYLFIKLIEKIITNFSMSALEKNLMIVFKDLITEMLNKQYNIDLKKAERAKKALERKSKNLKIRIKPIYYKAAKLCHPDISKDNGDLFKKLNVAYNAKDYTTVKKIYENLTMN